MGRKKSNPAEAPGVEYPIVTRNATPHWEEINGKREWVQESIFYDWGPKEGVTRCYIKAPENDDPVKNAMELNRVLKRMGRRLAGHGSTLPPGMLRRPSPPPEP